jgi:hypothetical protein
MKKRFPCSFLLACHCKWLVLVKGISLTEAGILLKVNAGTLSHVMHERRFPGSFPIPLE